MPHRLLGSKGWKCECTLENREPQTSREEGRTASARASVPSGPWGARAGRGVVAGWPVAGGRWLWCVREMRHLHHRLLALLPAVLATHGGDAARARPPVFRLVTALDAPVIDSALAHAQPGGPNSGFEGGLFFRTSDGQWRATPLVGSPA